MKRARPIDRTKFLPAEVSHGLISNTDALVKASDIVKSIPSMMYVIALLGTNTEDEMRLPPTSLHRGAGLQNVRLGGLRDKCGELNEGNLHLP